MSLIKTELSEKTELEGIEPTSRGKVRDIYDAEDKLVVVATDRISAFDVVIEGSPIPNKGAVLTALSAFWFWLLADILPNHFISSWVDEFPPPFSKFSEQLNGRAMLVKKAKPFPVECIARGYLVGSGWKDYQKTGQVCEIQLPPGLEEGSKLPDPIFTPSTKAETGHDENISEEQMVNIVGRKTTTFLKEKTLELYQRGADYAEKRGIIIADTKFEFGKRDGEIILIDEALTPDSSRFWPKSEYRVGASQPSFDKQYVRDYLESIGWDKKPPAPALPPHVISRTSDKYIEAYSRLTED